MPYTMKINIANKSNYGGKRALSNIKYIVVHFTSNDGDTDENNGKYFKNNVVKASAHYFVDSDSVTQSVPEDYIAYSVGGSRYSDYKKTGGASFYKKATNVNTINIELCDDVKNGNVYPSAETIVNAIELTNDIMKRYGIPASNVIRHFDVNGKRCPSYWCGSNEKNALWLSEFKNKLTVKAANQTAKATNTAEYYPKYTGTTTSIVAALNSLNVDSSFSNRKKIATANGITGYAGTASQNIKMLNLLKEGKLKKA